MKIIQLACCVYSWIQIADPLHKVWLVRSSMRRNTFSWRIPVAKYFVITCYVNKMLHWTLFYMCRQLDLTKNGNYTYPEKSESAKILQLVQVYFIPSCLICVAQQYSIITIVLVDNNTGEAGNLYGNFTLSKAHQALRRKVCKQENEAVVLRF